MEVDRWRSTTLGEVVNLKRGYDLPKQMRLDGPFPIVSSSGVTGAHSEAKVKPPGVVTGRYGTLGIVHYVEQPFWPLNTTLYVQDFKGNHERFIAYLLESLDLGTLVSSAAVPGINRNHLHPLQVQVPDRPLQASIAEALGVFDDLIENNLRRIEFLEEMARLLYREWFVHFRFPGHEDVKLVDSDLGPIPEGWEACRLGDVLELVYGKALKSGDRMGGPVSVYGSGGQVGWHDEALATGPGIVVGRKGNVGSVHWSDRDFFPIDTTYYVKSELPLRFLDQMLRTQEFIDSHAAVPGLSRGQAYALAAAVPEDRLLLQYESAVRPMYDLRCTLSEQNAVLRETRDLLLPRLVSGELDISELDLELEVLGA